MKGISFLFLLTWVCALRSVAGQSDLQVVLDERIQAVSNSYFDPGLSSKWQEELTSNGNWSDVDYTSGCDARRANWPAQDHWHRILTIASMLHSDPSDIYLQDTISIALDYWFDRDFKEDDCINAGGSGSHKCPCGTPGFWNSNWYDQMILIPNLVGNACLLLLPVLSPTQRSNCTTQTSRAYVRLDGDPNGSMGPQTGANLLDVASIGVSLSLITSSENLLTEAYRRIFDECRVTENANKDGIKVDGSYLQHSRQLYTGNYGKVFMNNMLKFFIETKNAEGIQPDEEVQDAFLTLIDGAEWFIYWKNKTQELSWEYSVIGRMVSHRHEDWHGIDLSLSNILKAVAGWDNADKFQEIVNRLGQTGSNPGELTGTRYFYISDYLVHRGLNYISTLKMYSSRTTNSECNNGQNPYGFHLSDGSIFTYTSGDEYTNVFGALDWNSIPGTTTSYGTTKLSCSQVQHKGKESFVGATTLGNAGVAVMNYTNPNGNGIPVHWLKTYFFFPSMIAVRFIGNVDTDYSAGRVVTTLEQSQLITDVYIDGVRVMSDFVEQEASMLWHNGVEWNFESPVNLTVDVRERKSNWEEIGISKGNETYNFFHAFFTHSESAAEDAYSYYMRTGVGYEGFKADNSPEIKFISVNNESKDTAVARGVQYSDVNEKYLGIVFITAGEYVTSINEIPKISSDAPATILLYTEVGSDYGTMSVSDPTQNLSRISIELWLPFEPMTFTLDLPQGPSAGQSVTVLFVNDHT